MSLRLEMLQVARLAPRMLGDSTELVRAFFARQFTGESGGRDRAGQPDLYYTIFALAGAQALDRSGSIRESCAGNTIAKPETLSAQNSRADSSGSPRTTADGIGEPGYSAERVAAYLAKFDDGAGLDFVHLGALARCWAAVGLGRMPHGLSERILARIERHRARDGGYDADLGAAHGNAYGCFVALGAYQDLQRELPEPLRMVQCLKLLETADGAWANASGLKVGSTNATAAAVTLLHQLRMPINASVGDWLLAQAHPEGGFRAMPQAPIPDLLSTATTLHALACLEREPPTAIRERCLDFIDTLWSAEGGFHGHWADDDLDAEYTFYGLLALGHLSLGPTG